jgi:hypothetical protein
MRGVSRLGSTLLALALAGVITLAAHADELMVAAVVVLVQLLVAASPTLVTSAGDVVGSPRFAPAAVAGVVATVLFPNTSYPPLWVPFGLAGLAVLSYVACSVIGFPVPRQSGDPAKDAVTTFLTGTFLRLALAEGVAFVALALCFVLPDPSAWPYYIGGVLALVLMAAQAWPGDRAIARTQRKLDQNGVRVDLGTALGGPASSGPIQQF